MEFLLFQLFLESELNLIHIDVSTPEKVAPINIIYRNDVPTKPRGRQPEDRDARWAGARDAVRGPCALARHVAHSRHLSSALPGLAGHLRPPDLVTETFAMQGRYS